MVDRVHGDTPDQPWNPDPPRSSPGPPHRGHSRCHPVTLIAYTPPGTAGAYAERGPVFVHAERCDGYPTPNQYPPGLAQLVHLRNVGYGCYNFAVRGCGD